MLFLNTVLLLAIVLLVLSMMPRMGRTASLLAAFLSAVAVITVIIEAASLLRALTPLAITLGELLLLAGVGFLWWRRGRPDPLAALRLADLRREFVGAWRNWRQDWPYLLMIGGTLAILAFIGLRSASAYDVDYDSLTYHFPKLAIWLENRTISFLDPATRVAIMDQRIIESPPVSDFVYLWYFSGTGTTIGTQLFEWSSVFVTMLAIYGLGYALTNDHKPALLAAFIFATFELVIWNSQHVGALVSSVAFFMAGLYFFQRADRLEEKNAVFFACLGFALAIGSKYTNYFLMPLIGVLILAHIFKKKRPAEQHWLRHWLLSGVICLALFSSFSFVQNLVIYENPIPISDLNATNLAEDNSFWGCANTNLFRLSYWGFSTSILPSPLQGGYERWYQSVWAGLGDILNIPWTSSYCAVDTDFGPGLEPGYSIIIIPLLLGGLFFSIKKTIQEHDPQRLAVWLLIFEFYLLIAGLKGLRGHNFRYLTPAAALFSVALVDLFNAVKKRPLLEALIVIPSLLNMAGTLSPAYQAKYSPEHYIRTETIEIVNALLDSDEKVIAVFPDRLTVNAIFYGYDLSRDVKISTCASLADDLSLTETGTIVFSFIYPFTSYEDCITQSLLSGDALWRALTTDYTLRYETWFTNRSHVLIFQKTADLPAVAIYPSAFPVSDERIFISPSLAGRVGGGPVDYILKGTGLPGDDYLFSLRSAEEGLSVSVTAVFLGDTCQPGSEMHIRAYNNDSVLISEADYEIAEGENGRRLVTFDLLLDAGITRIFFAESACETEASVPLEFIRMDVE